MIPETQEASTPEDTPAISSDSVRVLLWLMVACGTALIVGGYLWLGLDFAVGALVGFMVVLANVLWTRNLVGALLTRSGFRVAAGGLFVLKFLLTIGVLFVAMLRFDVDPLGILVGLSVLLLSVLLMTMTPGFKTSSLKKTGLEKTGS